MTRRARTRTAVVLPVVAVLLPVAAGTSWAVAQARATGTQPVSTASFGAQPSTSATSASQPGPLVLTYGQLDAVKAPQDLFLRNTGTMPLTAQTWTVTVSDRLAGNGGTDVDLVVCVGGTYGVVGCSGAEQTVSSTRIARSTTTRSSIALPVGAALAARIVPNGGSSRGFTVTLSTSASRADATSARPVSAA